MAVLTKKAKRERRKTGIRKKVFGTAEKPRISVFRTNKYIFAQAVDDGKSTTLIGYSDKKITKGTKIERAKEVGKNLGEALKKSKVKVAVFDRNGFKYHGRVMAVADGIRESGITI